MDFGFTKKKLIVCGVLLVLFFILLTSIIIPLWYGINSTNNCNIDYGKATRDPLDNMRDEYCNNRIQILLLGNLIFGALFFILIYIIFSLFQKK